MICQESILRRCEICPPSDSKPTDFYHQSFILIVNRLVDQRLTELDNVQSLRPLLESDDALLAFIKEQLLVAQAMLIDLKAAISLMCNFLELLNRPAMSSTLYMKALSGEGVESAFFREFLLEVRMAGSDTLDLMLGAVFDCLESDDSANKEAGKLFGDLHALLNSTATDEPLHGQQSDILQTTVVKEKIQLSKQKAEVSPAVAQYSKILESFKDWLVVYFKQRFVPLEDIPLHEIVTFDLRHAHRAVFMPKTRSAVERALSSPHDYLNCECCETDHGNEATLAPTQPFTAIIYQLYLESGPMINVSDLWSAFNAIQGKDDDATEGAEENAAMPQFQRGLAELRYLGLVKNTRKKPDHVEKVSWKGL